MSCKSVASRTVKSCINHNQSRPNVASLSGAQWIAMPSQDWSTLTLNISGLDFCAVHTAAGWKRSCFACGVRHVCFHANSHKHRGCCQKCRRGGKLSSEQFGLFTASHPVKCLQRGNRNLLRWMDPLVITAEKPCNRKYQSDIMAPFICEIISTWAELISADDCIQCFEP